MTEKGEFGPAGSPLGAARPLRNDKEALGAGSPIARTPGDVSDAALLDRLASPQSSEAWREFLRDYSSLVMRIVRRHEPCGERSADCFLHVCAELSDDGFRRLRAWRADRPARFRTWLVTVVTNLCIDWRRREDGRIRPFRAIAGLPELEQQVYRHIFVHGLPRLQCLELLRPRFPDLTEAELTTINARLFGLLNPAQRYQLSLRTAAGPEAGGHFDDEDPLEQVQDPDAGPQALVEDADARERVRAALDRLPPDQRLVLRLRFERGLTLAEVARLTREPDQFRARRRIDAALAALARLVGE